MNLLALAVQVYGEPKILFPIPKKSFWPEPEVDSAATMIKNISRRRFTASGAEEKLFFKIIRAAFQGKRKVLANSLYQNLKIGKVEVVSLLGRAGISARERPESVPIHRWLQLTSLLAKELHKG